MAHLELESPRGGHIRSGRTRPLTRTGSPVLTYQGKMCRVSRPDDAALSVSMRDN